MPGRAHADPKTCPGAKYFEKKDESYKDEIRQVMTEVLGDVPKYMRKAGENRIWLWILSLLLAVDTGLIILVMIIISKLTMT